MQQKYKVSAFPTFLFFSPDGEIVHKNLGGKTVKSFIKMAEEATSPDYQYFTLLANYKKGQLGYAKMPYLANLSKLLNDNDIASQIAADYMRGYLNKLSRDSFCSKDNLTFIGIFSNIIQSKDPVFYYYYQASLKIDSIMGRKGYAQQCADAVIIKEEITPSLDLAKISGKKPDWSAMAQTIEMKYDNSYAKRILINVKPGFYFYKKDWANYATSLVELMESRQLNDFMGLGGSVYLNNIAWEVFQYSNNKAELFEALKWSERCLKLDTMSSFTPGNMDTKANLLYKAGMTAEAIATEKKVIILKPDDRGYKVILLKMEKGLPTWPGN
jgi:hypothetical protein